MKKIIIIFFILSLNYYSLNVRKSLKYILTAWTSYFGMELDFEQSLQHLMKYMLFESLHPFEHTKISFVQHIEPHIAFQQSQIIYAMKYLFSLIKSNDPCLSISDHLIYT